MKKSTLARLLLLSSLCVAFVGCATRSSVVPKGSGVFEVTSVAGNGFSTGAESIAKLRDNAMQEATQYCANQGKQMKVVAVNEDKPFLKGMGLAKVTVVFKALNAGDAELLQAEPAPLTRSVQGKVKQPYTPPPQQYVAQPNAPQYVAQPYAPATQTVAQTYAPAHQYVAQPAASQVVQALPPLTTDELVSELTKLDDLRKKGILTDDEFQLEKKKILSRSR
jgi:Short C-terminal domain